MSADTKPQPRWQREKVTLLLILAAAAVVRLALAMQPRIIKWDEPDYLTLGINLFAGRGYTTGIVPELHYTPLLPILAGVLHLLTQNGEWASNIVFIIAGTLLIVPVYGLARRMYGGRVALITAVLLVIYPALTSSVLFWGTMTEPLFILLVYSAFYCVLAGIEDERRWPFAVAGVLLSLAYLTRPEALISCGLLTLYLIVLWLVQKRLFTRAVLARLALLLAAFVLVAAPYIGFLYAKSGRLLITGKLGLTYAMGEAVLNKDPAEYDRLIASLDSTGTQIVWYSPDRFSYSVLGDLLSDPAAFAGRTLANAHVLSGQLFARAIFPTLLGVPVLLGLMRVAWDRRRLRREGLLAVLLAAPLVSFLPFHIEIRFFAPALPVLLIWTAHGIDLLGRWLLDSWDTLRGKPPAGVDAGWARRAVALLPLALALAFFVLMTPRVLRAGQSNTDWTHKDAGLWLEQNAAHDAVIMARDLAIAVYAERAWIPSPNASLDSVRSYAAHHAADYYVVDQPEITSLRPQLSVLADVQTAPAWLRHEKTFTHGKNRTIVYSIVQP